MPARERFFATMSLQFGGLLLVVGMLAGGAVSGAWAQEQAPEPNSLEPIVVDDFESYAVGNPPGQWVRVKSEDKVRPAASAIGNGERFTVVEENDNQFARLYTNGEYIRFSQRAGKEFQWSLKTHPRLRWRWRALTLPEGASEKGKNDTGGAVYVTFGKDWLGRPKSIKYTYSSSLPVGTVVSFGPLKVIVVDSAAEPHPGAWQTVQRNVMSDYQQVFGDTPPRRPVSLTISGDSDTTNDVSEVDIDDITLLPAR
ncbi:MAG: DUF3047 domain-containing protein [Salinibacter sp.]